MASLLPEDANGNPIPALKFKDSGAHKVNIDTVTSARNTGAFSTKTDVISIYSTEDCFVKIGTSSVTATTSDHFIPAGIYLDIAIGPNADTQNAYMAVIAANASGTVYISEKE
ncbi:MAG: hypothetical protein NZ828_11655 [Alphaproteobacteria bacterium]|nr:hypothetical protein [Alphaproteobacteria bacterium]